MRRGNNPDIITLDDGTFVGFDLSADYCAEHEWGLKLKDAFGIKDTGLGVKRRQISKVPTPKKESDNTWFSPRCLDFFQRRGYKKESYLVFDYPDSINHLKDGKGLSHEFDLSKYNKTEVAGAWDDSSFGVATTKYHDEIKKLYDSFLKKDIVIGLFGGGVFKNAGLKLLIASLIPEYIKKEWYDSDKDQKDLEAASKKTGIHKKLEKAGKSFFALSPRWAKDIGGTEGKTKHPVAYWLNPCEQHKYNSCWCTVEDLELWAQEKGPVVK
jgi:hypothetical protein